MIKLKEVEDAIGKLYLIEDKGVIRTLLATIIANRISRNTKAVWMLFIAGSSGGKTMLTNLLSNVGKWIIPVDTLTTNTFASGLNRDKSTSLLDEANNGIIIFKDLTVLINLNRESLVEIMGQLRGIHDGEFVKRTGNEVAFKWEGKVGIVAAGTIAVQRKLRQFSPDGERFLNYRIKLPDPDDVTKRVLLNESRETFAQEEEDLFNMVSEFINDIIDNTLPMSSREIPQCIQDEITEISNFATLARSPVEMNFKNPKLVMFVHDREGPARVAKMLVNLADALMIISNEEVLSRFNSKILYKIALDSIPAERKMVLELLAKYRNATTSSIGIRLNLPTETVIAWLSQLNALSIVKKTKPGSSFVWELKKKYKDLMVDYIGIDKIDEELDEIEEKEGLFNAYTQGDEIDEAPEITGF
ncbi:MAG: hypothetical protein U9R00_02295 [Patescibacteria group bacterium]|nr:hypothetical protein [Patescibacteria group bacterium]